MVFKVDIITSLYPTCTARAGKEIGVDVHMFVDQNKLNRTLAINSPFQTFAVGHLVEFIG